MTFVAAPLPHLPNPPNGPEPSLPWPSRARGLRGGDRGAR